MRTHADIGGWTMTAGMAAALLAVGCASTQPRIERYRPMVSGSTSTMSVTDTGSYGSGTTQVTTTFVHRTWQGRPVIAWENAAGAILVDPANEGRRLGYVGPAGQTIFTLTPAVGLSYPLVVGKTWTTESTLTMMGPQGNRAVPARGAWKVHGIEEVTVPAGTFKAMRITLRDTMAGKEWNDDTYWIDPAQEIAVKVLQKRQPTHPAGAGTRESVLVSHSIRF